MSDRYLYLVLKVTGGVHVKRISQNANVLTIKPSIPAATAYIYGKHLYIAIRGKYVTRDIPRWYMSTREMSDDEISSLDRYITATSSKGYKTPYTVIPYVGGIEIIDANGTPSLLGMEEIPQDVVKMVNLVLG